MLLRLLLLAVVLLAAGPAAAQADIVDASLAGKINESYDNSVAVSGSPLVGLRLGGVQAASGNSVIVAGPPAADNGVCLRVTTRDGRFSAANFYAPAAGVSGELIRVAPLAQEYEPQLSRYPADEVAFRAFASASGNCSPGGAVNLPIFDGDPAEPRQLVVFANGKSQAATASLYETEASEAPAGLAPVATAGCTPAGGSMIAFDLVCKLQLPPGFNGRALLSVEFSDGFSTDRYDYRTLVPHLAAR